MEDRTLISKPKIKIKIPKLINPTIITPVSKPKIKVKISKRVEPTLISPIESEIEAETEQEIITESETPFTKESSKSYLIPSTISDTETETKESSKTYSIPSIISDTKTETKESSKSYSIPSTISDTKTEEKEDYCEKEKLYLLTRKELNRQLKEYNKLCENSKYLEITKYFNREKKQIEDLLRCIYELNKHNKLIKRDMGIRDFLNMFPRDNSVGETNFRRQHIFEALCKILLFFNYDNGEFGKSKVFYESIEKFKVTGVNKEQIREDFLRSSLNEGSKSQSVDIFFKIPIGEKVEKKCKWACDCKIDSEKDKEIINESDIYVLIQNKFYENEKSDPSKYDIPKMYSRAEKLKSLGHLHLILMVNDKTSLEKKFKSMRYDDSVNIKNIYGLEEINPWFINLLYNMSKYPTFEEFKSSGLEIISKKDAISLRFHQELFINITKEYLEKKPNKRKFVWGAVPRSGKSFMIGGFISQLNPIDNSDIVIILGAKTETQHQFREMFKNYSDFQDYNIILGDSLIEPINRKKSKTIYIFSQEYFKSNKIENLNKLITDDLIDESELKFKPTFKGKSDFISLFLKKQIRIFFDEIHKGGSTQTALGITRAFINEGFDIKSFIMVTATFNKPNLAYQAVRELGDIEPVIIEWTYEDNQLMKELTEHNIETLENNISKRVSEDSSIEITEFRKLLEDYNGRFGNDYISILQEEYSDKPQLVLVEPYTATNNYNFSEILKNTFILNCEGFDYLNKEKTTDPRQIFKHYDNVRALIEFLAGSYIEADERLSYNLPKGTIYNYLLRELKYQVFKSHTELWFLPYSDLFEDNDCDEVKERNKEILRGLENEEEDEDKVKLRPRMGRPNIETVSRGLALALLEHPFFKQNFIIGIVHGHSKLFRNSGVNNENIFIYENGEVPEWIRDLEFQAKAQNKSLIILTGQKLRLGVSLPCADIAFNFDNIKSVDSNYQTMFRVLTERPNKKYGYYFDFNTERTIQFLYDYENIYGNALGRQGGKLPTIEDQVNELQYSIFKFNFNGITLRPMEDKGRIKIYDKLTERLKLNNNGIRERLLNNDNVQLTIVKLINTDGNIEIYKPIWEVLKEIGVVFDRKSKKIIEVLKKGKDAKVIGEKDKIEADEVEEEIEEQATEQNKEILKLVSDILPSIPIILAIFSNEENFNCSDMLECLKKCKENIEELYREGKSLCSCPTINNIFGCYYPEISSGKTLKFIESIITLLDNSKNVRLLSLLNLTFKAISEKISSCIDGGEECLEKNKPDLIDLLKIE